MTHPIEAAEDALLKAMLAADVAALDCLIDDQLLFLAPSGLVATKQMDLENYRSGTQVVRHAERLSLAVEPHGEDLVVTTALVELSLTFQGQRVDGVFR